MVQSDNTPNEPLPDLHASEWQEIARSSYTRTLLLKSTDGDASFVCKQLSQVEDTDYLTDQLNVLTRLENEPVDGVLVYHQAIREGKSAQLLRRYCPGTSLSKYIDRIDDTPGILRLAIQLAEILEQLHLKKLFHGNIKPANVIVGTEGSLTLVDGPLDFARLCCSINNLPDRDQIAFYSPEQLGIINDRPGAVSDLYSLGIILFECLTGHHPFSDCDNGNILVRKTLAIPNRFHDRNGNLVPRVLCELISRLTNSVPFNRYQTATRRSQ